MKSGDTYNDNKDLLDEGEKELDMQNNEMTLFRPKRRVASYEEAFSLAGFGVWQYFLLLQCGWANASDAIEIMCVSFIIPAVGKSMHISYTALSALTIVLFLGMMIGGYMWGSLADTFGRRKIIICSLTVNSVFGALSALPETYWLLLLLRFISGIGVGGSLPVCFAYFSEFQSNERRGAMISALATCWMAGNILVAGLAWLVLPEENNFSIISPHGEPWRLFILVCTIPSLSSAFFFYFMPDSPRYYYEKGELDKALEVLRIVHKWNHQRNPTAFPVSKIRKDDREDNPERVLHDNSDPESSGLINPRLPSSSNHSKWRRILSNCLSQLSDIYSKDNGFRYKSLALTVVYLALAFGGYGMSMWMPVLMEKTEKNGGSPCLGHTSGNKSSTVTEVPDLENSYQMYVDVFIGAAAQLPANILTILVMDRLGAKLLLTCSLLSSGISVLFFWLVNSKVEIIILSAIFNAVTTVAWNSLDVISVEMFPTRIRSTANGFLGGLSRIAAIVGTLLFGVFMDLDCSIPIVIVFIVLLIGGLISFKLPSTKQRNLL